MVSGERQGIIQGIPDISPTSGLELRCVAGCTKRRVGAYQERGMNIGDLEFKPLHVTRGNLQFPIKECLGKNLESERLLLKENMVSGCV